MNSINVAGGRRPGQGEGDGYRITQNGAMGSARMRGIHDLDGPSGAELVRDGIRTAIHRCELRPGQAIRLRDVADEQRVRFATLVLLVQRLEYEDLLTVRGDVAIVAPLDGDKLSAAQRFGMRIERALIPRSFELLTPAHLAEIGSLLPPPDAGRLDFADDFVLNGAGVIETLYAGASRFDRREIQMLIDHGKRYNVFAGLQTDSLGTGAAHAYCDVQREIVNLLRAGLIAPAVDLQLTLFERLHAFGQQSLDYPQLSDDDQPMATVLPIGASARRRRATHEGT